MPDLARLHRKKALQLAYDLPLQFRDGEGLEGFTALILRQFLHYGWPEQCTDRKTLMTKPGKIATVDHECPLEFPPDPPRGGVHPAARAHLNGEPLHPIHRQRLVYFLDTKRELAGDNK